MISKFRAWIEERKWMAEVADMDYFNQEVHFWNPEDENDQRIYSKGFDQAEVLMSTGRKDVTKAEIFSGHICEFKVPHSLYLGSPSSGDEKFIGEVRYDEEDASFFFASTNDKFPHVKFWYARNIKIIGNVYQNANLLEDSK